MFSRLRNAAGLALVMALVTTIVVFAKGGFSFITISGAELEEQVRASDLGLTEDFFAFADFYRDKVEAPGNPGQGYEITRYYIDGKREIAFDRLHYYPETGYVFYDGILNGDSEYDGEWYSANPAIGPLFESVLLAVIAKGGPAQPGSEVVQSPPAASVTPSQIALPVVIMAGLGCLFWFAMRFRKLSVH